MAEVIATSQNQLGKKGKKKASINAGVKMRTRLSQKKQKKSLHKKEPAVSKAASNAEETPIRKNVIQAASEISTDVSGIDEEKKEAPEKPPPESSYAVEGYEDLGSSSEVQIMVVSDENKGLIWGILKQVRPGMDLSRVVLPTFILEPRSLLIKFADYFYHADLLSAAVMENDPYTRMKKIVRWFLSGFYKKPKGLKKPYNPILGEVFRCYWSHPSSNSRTFYMAEQVSHHPPVSAFHVTNRKDGFSISAAILARSKFHGNSVSAIMDGDATLTLLNRGEDYLINLPYASCKGIFIGTPTVELGGRVSIECEKTGYNCELDFKLKPFFGGQSLNRITGKISLGTEILSTLEGHWDERVDIKECSTLVEEMLWCVTKEVKQSRLKRCIIPIEKQQDFESQRLWARVSEAIERADQQAATTEKCILEDIQRSAADDRKAKEITYTPRLFKRHLTTGEWIYKYADTRPWDYKTDLIQYENEFIIQTNTRFRAPPISNRLSFEQGESKRRSSVELYETIMEKQQTMEDTIENLQHKVTALSRKSVESSAARRNWIFPLILCVILIQIELCWIYQENLTNLFKNKK